MSELDDLTNKLNSGELLPHVEFCVVAAARRGYKSAATMALDELEYLRRVERAAQELADAESERDMYNAGLRLIAILEGKLK